MARISILAIDFVCCSIFEITWSPLLYIIEYTHVYSILHNSGDHVISNIHTAWGSLFLSNFEYRYALGILGF